MSNAYNKNEKKKICIESDQPTIHVWNEKNKIRAKNIRLNQAK